MEGEADRTVEAELDPGGSHIIRVQDRFYILATSAAMDDRNRVLKNGDTFAVFDRHGDVQPFALGEQGLYHDGTRYLSRFVLWLGSERLLLLNSTVLSDNTLLAIDMMNVDLYEDEHLQVPHGTVHLFRGKFISDRSCFERLRITNYGSETVHLPLAITFEADFADIFEVRVARRAERGVVQKPVVGDDRVTLSYEGLDGVVRSTTIVCSPRPDTIDMSSIRMTVEIEPGASEFVTIVATCDATERAPATYDDAYRGVVGAAREGARAFSHVGTTNEQFNGWVDRSVADLRMMITALPEGPYPYAGVPWYSTPFGRDGIITALEASWVNPQLARGVLTYLAETQATEVDPENDAEPGKILHETRGGEMAALGEIPFRRYYGSVDATPLYVMLAGAYHRATADLGTILSIWPSIDRAIEWIDTYGDADGDGFVEYQRHGARGLVNQGWKDSEDSVFHADGSLPVGPVALAEVQGYVYAAKREAAVLAGLVGRPERADALLSQAEQLRAHFEEAFWCEDIGTYAIALDGDKRPCRVRTSNAGLCLFSGIASAEHAAVVAESLLSEEFFSGWGIRTVASTEVRYNPMSYHNGSVWPHDNAMIAAGLARYGRRDLALRVFEGLFDASALADQHRLPELFCGFRRRVNEGPTLYPVACSPQAWSAATVFLLLSAVLGLDVDATARRLSFQHGVLPPALDGVKLSGLRVGDAVVDIEIRRHDTGTTVAVLERDGEVDVVAVK